MKDYVTIKTIAEEWNLTPRRVQIMCADGKIPGAVKFGRDWAIPRDAEKPIDMRIKSGAYVNWRNSSSKES